MLAPLSSEEAVAVVAVMGDKMLDMVAALYLVQVAVGVEQATALAHHRVDQDLMVEHGVVMLSALEQTVEPLELQKLEIMAPRAPMVAEMVPEVVDTVMPPEQEGLEALEEILAVEAAAGVAPTMMVEAAQGVTVQMAESEFIHGR